MRSLKKKPPQIKHRFQQKQIRDWCLSFRENGDHSRIENQHVFPVILKVKPLGNLTRFLSNTIRPCRVTATLIVCMVVWLIPYSDSAFAQQPTPKPQTQKKQKKQRQQKTQRRVLRPVAKLRAKGNPKGKIKKGATVWLDGLGPVPEIVTVRIEHEKEVYYGRPLGQDSAKIALVRWDGRITTLPRDVKMTYFSDGFAPYSAEELETRLQKQYGSRYLTQSTKHFTIVYPRTQPKDWGKLYEATYKQFKDYLARHKIDIAEPRFPMIVVVLGSRNEFDRSLASEIIFKRGVFGYYSRITNRVTTYVSSDPRIARQIAQLSNVTVVHETIHQAAFNTGVHNRLCAVPSWMSEGFAMLFESRGFRKSKPDQLITDRVNTRRLRTLKKMFQSGRARGTLKTMLVNDRLFETDPDLAYSLAWGLSFYLAEKEKDKYLRFVIVDGNTNQFAKYTTDQRITFFAKTFGADIDALERRLEKFILKLPQ